MKSIKEKAQKWADMYPSCGMADKSFKAGANYVLEQIENIVNKHYHSEINWEMSFKELIKQLKK